MDHPEEPEQRQVRTRRFERWVVQILPFVAISVTLVALVSLAVLEDWRSRSSSPAGTGAGPPVAQAPRQAASGRYQATVVPPLDTPLASQRPGWIRRILVKQGQRVAAGQVVAVLQPADDSGARAQTAHQADAEALAAASTELRDARGAVAAAESAASATRTRLSNAKTALTAARNALTTARARATAASQALKQADAAVEDARSLFEQGVVAEQALRDAQRAQTEAATAGDEAARAVEEAQADIAAAQDRVDAEQEALNQAQARLSSARSAAAAAERAVTRLRTSADRSQADARSLERNGQPFEIRSPAAGVVSGIALSEGALATPGTAVVTIRPEETSVAVFDVTDGETANLRAGMPVEVREPRSGRSLTGRIAVVQPLPAGGQRRNRVVVEVRDPSGALRPGTSVAIETNSASR